MSATEQQKKLHFTTLDVFTTRRFFGNPLAIVHIPATTEELTQAQKQRIAKEFNLSETVFLHLPPSGSVDRTDIPITIDIFTPNLELPFAGHPTIGTSWYILNHLRETSTAAPTSSIADTPSSPQSLVSPLTLRTKAGDIPVSALYPPSLPNDDLTRGVSEENVSSDSGRSADGRTRGVRVRVPQDFKIHAAREMNIYKAYNAAQLRAEDYANPGGVNGTEPIVSIVRGLSFFMVEVTSEEALGRARGGLLDATTHAEEELGPWSGHVGVYIFWIEPGGKKVRTRMFGEGMEDPATGSAAAALGGYIARRFTGGGNGHWEGTIVQGVEMNRASEIWVGVDTREDGEPEKIEIGGNAVVVMKGEIIFD